MFDPVLLVLLLTVTRLPLIEIIDLTLSIVHKPVRPLTQIVLRVRVSSQFLVPLPNLVDLFIGCRSA